jgi:hypothetical protein
MMQFLAHSDPPWQNSSLGVQDQGSVLTCDVAVITT